jgi:hypothetical protein
METNSFSVKVLSLAESIEVNGGVIEAPPKWLKWVKGGVVAWIGTQLIANWSEIKSGLVDGWTDAMNEQ